ncbi:MAG: diacylglycerol kinase family protein [Aestuariivirga sp.]|uniref:diacylglycerol kinase family protein n=1 Tax=Aestuariivirga sp. TaxID=2650926 RepID=UPI0038D24DF5
MSGAAASPARHIGLIINPQAGKASGKGTALAAKLARDHNISIRTLQRFGDLGQILDGLARDGVTDLFISSGDGTIQEILTEIAERKMFRQTPRLCLLPHGTTNLSANDIGFRGRSTEAEAAFIRNPAASGTAIRHTIRCANPGDGKARHGMFVGTGAVAEATRYCQQAFNQRGVRGQWAVARTLLAALRKHLLGKPANDDESRFDRPFAITVDAGGQRLAEGPQLLQMSTTLDKLALNARPFWGGKTGPIRTTVLPYPVPSVLRWTIPVMYGAENRRAPAGAVSFCGERLEVSSKTVFVIDGEFFAPPRAPLLLETGPAFSFLTG